MKKRILSIFTVLAIMLTSLAFTVQAEELPTETIDISKFTVSDNRFFGGYPKYITGGTDVCTSENDGKGVKIAYGQYNGGQFDYEFEVEKSGTYELWQKDSFYIANTSVQGVTVKLDGANLKSGYKQPQNKYYWSSGIEYNKVGNAVYLEKGKHTLSYSFWKGSTGEEWGFYLLGAEFRCTSLDKSVAYLSDIEYKGVPAKVNVMLWDSLDAIKPVDSVVTFKSSDNGASWVQQ